jgi:type II secretory pathway pseudopilin PulG
MMFKKTQNQTPCFTKALWAFSLTEALLAVVLVGVVSALALSALNVSGHIQGVQANKVVQSAMMEIQASITKYKQRNGIINETTPYSLSFDMLDATPVTTNLALDGNTPTGATYTCNTAGWVCRRLKSGAVVLYGGSTVGTWGVRSLYNPRNIRVGHIVIDPDGVNSDSTNDAGQSVKLLLTMQGTFLTSTAWQWTQVGVAPGVTVEQPQYFRLDR